MPLDALFVPITQGLPNGFFYSQFSECSVSGGEAGLCDVRIEAWTTVAIYKNNSEYSSICPGSLLISNTRGQYLI